MSSDAEVTPAVSHHTEADLQEYAQTNRLSIEALRILDGLGWACSEMASFFGGPRSGLKSGPVYNATLNLYAREFHGRTSSSGLHAESFTWLKERLESGLAMAHLIHFSKRFDNQQKLIMVNLESCQPVEGIPADLDIALGHMHNLSGLAPLDAVFRSIRLMGTTAASVEDVKTLCIEAAVTNMSEDSDQVPILFTQTGYCSRF